MPGELSQGSQRQKVEAEKARSERAAGGYRWRITVIGAYLAVYLVWGSTYLGIKYAIETLPPLLMAGSRFLIAGAALYGWSHFSSKGKGAEREGPRMAHWRAAIIIGGLLFLCGNGGVTWAENRITSSLAALLVATEPLWIVLLGWARRGGVRPSGKVVLGLLMGFAGVWLLIGKGAGAGELDLFGALLVVGAAFCWALGSLYSARAPMPASPLRASAMQMLAGGALLLVAATLSGEWARLRLGEASLRSILAFSYLTVFGSIVAFTAYSWLLRNVALARATTYAYVNPLVAVFLGWALAGEALTLRTIVAAGVIIASVALITSYGKRRVEKLAAVADNGDGVGTSVGDSGGVVQSSRQTPKQIVPCMAGEEGC